MLPSEFELGESVAVDHDAILFSPLCGCTHFPRELQPPTNLWAGMNFFGYPVRNSASRNSPKVLSKEWVGYKRPSGLVSSIQASPLSPFPSNHSLRNAGRMVIAALSSTPEPKYKKLGISAHFEFVGTTDGEPTFVKLQVLKGLTNDPTLGGPFAYHIHTNPIPPDGDCTKLNGTTDGKIATFGYSDAYVRFFPETHSLLGRSIVIHSSNKTRLACGNITSFLDGTADVSFRPTYRRSKYVKDYPTTAPIQPSPPVIPFNGTVMTDPAIIATFPYPLPVPALSLAEALNVKLVDITHSVKFANVEQSITQPSEKKVMSGFNFLRLALGLHTLLRSTEEPVDCAQVWVSSGNGPIYADILPPESAAVILFQ
ncbi:copper/zinc superoxide dismutase domain-containing protein [Rhizoctonia solani AG-1 IA]|uniref:Copper/zinc superoxide dismutase domain-containing protein n=1 Tax=Thanatephorus cucumeris (strain AG1-IA) TaxID=983506 RepID=L8WLN8_THACA|nr:copper/zinc superoxide dismutase domain-containing protein [Rhizoctonia solani AG-1 IA]